MRNGRRSIEAHCGSGFTCSEDQMELTSEMIAAAFLFLLLQVLGAATLIYHLRTYIKKFPSPAEAPNPFNQLMTMLFIVPIAMGVFGLLLSVGQFWFFMIEAPIIICLILGLRVLKNRS
jgi:hypothetical protein